MGLIEKLEAKRREVDDEVRESMRFDEYDFKAADLRDLLDEVLASIHPPLMMVVPDDYMEHMAELTAGGHLVWTTRSD